MNRYHIPKRDEDDDQPARLEFRYLLAGAPHGDAARQTLQEELQELIPHLLHLNLLPVNQGLHLDLEVASTAPFDSAEFEVYLVDHILLPLLERETGSAEPVSVRPLRSRRS